jgi:hypothetical protein
MKLLPHAIRHKPHAIRDTTTNSYVRNYKQNMQNKANFRKSQMNVSNLFTMDYVQMDTWSGRKNKAKTKPIQTQFKAKTNPIQTQFKPKQTQLVVSLPALSAVEGAEPISEPKKQSQKHVQAFFEGILLGGLEFFSCWPAIYSGVLECPETRPILVHHINCGFWTDLLIQKVNNLETACQVLRQNKVPNQKAACSCAVFCCKIAHLPVHLLDGGKVNLRIIRCIGEFLGNAGIRIFHVRHIDIDESVEQLQRFDRIIASGIVNRRQYEAVFAGQFDCLCYCRHDMCWGNEIYVAAAEFLQAEHCFSQLFNCDPAAVPLMADIRVLAKDTAEVAAGKKNSAGAPPADEDGFLAEVRADRADDGHVGDAAKTGLALTAVDFTLARTENAGIH